MIPTSFLLLLLAAGAGGEGPPAQGPESVLARYDLTGLLPTFDAGTVAETMMALSGTPFVESYHTSSGELYARAGAEDVVDLLTRLFSEEFEYEGRALAMQGPEELLVLAPPEVQDKVRAALAAFEQVLTAYVELQVDVLSLPPDGPPPFGGECVVDAAQLGSLPSSAGRPRETYTVRLYAGRTSIIDRRRDVPVVIDYDIEIAQGSLIHDPVVGRAEAGTRLLLHGVPAGDGLALTVYYSHAHPLSDEPQPIEAPQRAFVSTESGGEERFVDAPKLQERLELGFRSVAFNTVLPAGKALVFSSGMDLATARPDVAEKSREVVVIRRVGGDLPRFRRFAAPGSKRELVFVNAEAMQGPEIKAEGSLLGGDEEHNEAVPVLQAQMEPQPSLFLMDWISPRFSTWRPIGPWVVCAYDQALDETASADLERLAMGWKPELRLTEVDLRARARGAETASWKLPLRAGSPAAGLVGLATSALVDYDVEVAQFAAGADPTTFPQFSGLAFRAGAAPPGAGGTALELEAVAHVRRGPPRMDALGGPFITRLEKSTFDVLRVEDRVVAGAGAAAITLGDRGEQGGALSLDVAVK